MSVLIFVLFWTVVAVTLVFLAINGGARGARERLHKQSQRGRRVSYLLFALFLLGFGVAIPAVVVAGVDDRSAVPQSGISSLTAQEKHGREVFGQQCRICHTLQAAGAVASVGPNLDNLRPTKALVLDAIKNGRARGNGAMAADLVEGSDAEAVAAFVAKAVGQDKPAKSTGASQ
jgi:mono/diheme cytochrome c family protein